MNEMQPILITSGAGVVLLIGNPMILYAFMFIISATCIVWTVSILRGCKSDRKRLEALKTRATRRNKNAATDTTSH